MIKFTCNSQSKKSCWLLYDFAFLPPEVLNIIFCLDWVGQEFINTLPPLSQLTQKHWMIVSGTWQPLYSYMYWVQI